MKNAYKILVGNPEGKRPFGNLEADASVLLNGC
jgi:hypothetical protein